jgi:hypothetical protein
MTIVRPLIIAGTIGPPVIAVVVIARAVAVIFGHVAHAALVAHDFAIAAARRVPDVAMVAVVVVAVAVIAAAAIVVVAGAGGGGDEAEGDQQTGTQERERDTAYNNTSQNLTLGRKGRVPC